MKKFLGLLSGLSIAAISSTSVVSCVHDPIDIKNIITTTDLGVFYYPKRIKKENMLPSEGEIWTRISEYNPKISHWNGLKFSHINILNIDSSTAKIIISDDSSKFDYYENYVGEVIINFVIKEKDEMQLDEIITMPNHSWPSIYPSINVGELGDKNKIDYLSYVTKYLDKLYTKIKGIYNLKDITPIDINSIIKVCEFPLPLNNSPLTEDYIWSYIEKYNYTENDIHNLTKKDVTIHIKKDLVEPNIYTALIMGKDPHFDGEVKLSFDNQIKEKDLKVKDLSYKDKWGDEWYYRDRFFKISLKPERNVKINGEMVIKLTITENKYDGI